MTRICVSLTARSFLTPVLTIIVVNAVFGVEGNFSVSYYCWLEELGPKDFRMSDPTRGERLQIMLTEDELGVLDDWRFARRMPSRAAAVRELLRRGLAAEGFAAALAGKKSEDFGVTDGANPGRGPNGD